MFSHITDNKHSPVDEQIVIHPKVKLYGLKGVFGSEAMEQNGQHQVINGEQKLRGEVVRLSLNEDDENKSGQQGRVLAMLSPPINSRLMMMVIIKRIRRLERGGIVRERVGVTLHWWPRSARELDMERALA